MRTAKQTILIAVVLALPYLVTGIISDGPYAGRLIGGGIVLLVIAGAAAAFMAWRGRRLDEAQDERQAFVVGKADAVLVLRHGRGGAGVLGLAVRGAGQRRRQLVLAAGGALGVLRPGLRLQRGAALKSST